MLYLLSLRRVSEGSRPRWTVWPFELQTWRVNTCVPNNQIFLPVKVKALMPLIMTLLLS